MIWYWHEIKGSISISISLKSNQGLADGFAQSLAARPWFEANYNIYSGNGVGRPEPAGLQLEFVAEKESS